jgi:glycosyltransferase involved in cell wall biosynthesis
LKYLPFADVKHIYNPVQDEIYKPKDLELTYNKDLMIWAASPHKGLGRAIQLFKRIHEKLPKLHLAIAHPGYFNIDTIALQSVPGVSLLGPISCRRLWGYLQNSLCLYYPSTYPETFCNLLAEANALGVPMLGFNHGVLKQTVSSRDQLVEESDDAIVNQAIKWYNGDRPKVSGNEDYKLSTVVFKWISLLADKR